MRTRSRSFTRGCLALSALAVLLVGLAGCEAIFTYTPLESLQRSPSSLPPEQRLEYARNALASGDPAAMKAALEAIQNDPGAAAQYMAAQLGIEVSGVPQLLLDAVDGTITIDALSINAFLAANPGVQPDYLVAAAARLASADPSTLTPMDYLYGALGLALDAADQGNGTYDLTSLDAGKTVIAQAFITKAVGALDPSDPMAVFVNALDTFV